MLEEGYTFADDGKMVQEGETPEPTNPPEPTPTPDPTNPPEPTPTPEVKNGIVAENGSLWYYVDGQLNYAGLIQIGDDYYYVRTSGEVVHGRSYWCTKTNGLMDEKAYTFADDGKMVNP